MGYLMLFIFLFLAWYMIFRIPMLLFNCIRELISTIYDTTVYIKSEKEIIKELDKNNFLNKKDMEKYIKQQEKEEKQKHEIIKKQNQIAASAVYQTNQLRVRYPYADENLFIQYLNRYPFALLDELQKIEEAIENSHNINYYNYDIPKKYTVKDTESMELLNTYTELPLILEVFKNEKDYLLLIKNIDRGEYRLFQSRNYIIITTFINDIIERQKQLEQFKIAIESEELDILYNKVVNLLKEI